MNERRTAVVTGSAGALGRALAVRLSREGWRLALVDQNAVGNRETLRLVEAAGGEGRIETMNVAAAADWAALSERLRADWPRLDLLVNNAGVAGGGVVGDFTLADWEWLLAVDLNSVVYGCHTFADWLKANPNGAHVVNTASFAAFACLPEMAAYNVAKAGVLALSETLRAEWALTKVGVTVVCPAFFSSALMDTARMRTEVQRDFALKEMKQADCTAESVAEDVVRAVARKQFYVFGSRRALWIWRLKRLSPAYFFSVVKKRYRSDPNRHVEPSPPPSVHP